MERVGRFIAVGALAVGSFGLMPSAGATEASLALPCEYGSEEGPSYDLGPACDQAWAQALDAVVLVVDLANNTVAYVNEQKSRVCQELEPWASC